MKKNSNIYFNLVNQFRVQILSSSGQGVTWGQIKLQLINNDGFNETFALNQEIYQLKEEENIMALVVAHMRLNNVTKIKISYTKYKGWIYNGLNEWRFDRIEILDNNSNLKSFCKLSTILKDSVTVTLTLLNGNCTINNGFEEFESNSHQTSSISTNSILPNVFNSELEIIQDSYPTLRIKDSEAD
ncbi:hypothetical protein NH340_JMT03605, partial [Sarcoptes scabiei]